MSNVAVIVMDMQDGYLDIVSKDEASSVIAKQNEVINYAKSRGWGIFYTKGKGRGELDERLIIEGEIFGDKTDGSAFSIPTLAETLKQFDTLVFMGCYKSVCVFHSIRDALNKGYEVLASDETLLDPRDGVDDVDKVKAKVNGFYELLMEKENTNLIDL